MDEKNIRGLLMGNKNGGVGVGGEKTKTEIPLIVSLGFQNQHCFKLEFRH